MFSGIKVKGKEEEADGSVSFLFFPRLVCNGAGFTEGCWGCSFPAGVAGEDIIVTGAGGFLQWSMPRCAPPSSNRLRFE
jgi:hypothetical protein